MKRTIILILFLVIQSACGDRPHKETMVFKAKIPIANKKVIHQVINKVNITSYRVNPTLKKLFSDTLKITNDKFEKRSHPSFLPESESFVTLSNDTLRIESRAGFMQTTNMLTTLHKGKFWINFSKNNCTYGHSYEIIEQKLTLNKSDFVVGDTLLGEFLIKGIYFWDERDGIEGNHMDTTSISGKFKLKIRDKSFNYNKLFTENKYKQLLIALATKRADTVKYLDFRSCGLTYLPKKLKWFKNLEWLSLEGNNFKNADLSFICSLTKLKYLNLEYCSLSKFPPSVFCLENLRVLNLDHNQIKTVPTRISRNTQLNELHLAFNHLTFVSEGLVNLKYLQLLHLHGDDNKIKRLPRNLFKSLPYLTDFYPPETDSAEFRDYTIMEEKRKLELEELKKKRNHPPFI